MKTLSPTAAKAVAIRKRFKALGWTAKHVSVRTHNYSMGSSIYVEVKSLDVDVSKATTIAEEAQRISRCSITGDILSGGNRFVSVSLSSGLRSILMDRHETAVQVAIDELNGCGRESAIITVEGTRSGVSKSGNGYGYQLWHGLGSDTGGTSGRFFDDARQGSLEIATKGQL